MQIENVFGNSKVTPFYGFGWNNEITFAAATTCYQSEQTTSKTPADFVQMFKSGKHRSPLEFSWYVLSIVTTSDPTFLWKYIFSKTLYLKLDMNESSRTIIISGNGRAFFEFLEQITVSDNAFYNKDKSEFIKSIKYALHKENPILFEDTGFKSNLWDVTCLPWDVVRKEYKKHMWIAFMIQNVSIGFSRESNRHRTISVNERSTRYTGAGKDPIIKYSMDPDRDYIASQMYMAYADLKANNVKNDISRQALPLANCTELIVAGTLSAWSHYIDLRSDTKAHYEIREVACKISALIEGIKQ